MSKGNNIKKEEKMTDEAWTPDVVDRSLPFYTDEDRMAFKIDRQAEDAAVVRFQNTKDEKIFEKLYNDRIPTLQVWARRYYYLLGGVDDMFGEFSYYFAKAAYRYNQKRGSFNTCLFTFLMNCVRNLRSGKKAKKRKPINSDPNSIANFVLSLDYGYNDKDGTGNTLKDILSDTVSDGKDISDDIDLEETIDMLAKNDPMVRSFLRKLSNGDTLASVIKEIKTRKGKIKISHSQAQKLHRKPRQKSIVIELIKDKTDISDDFSLLDYHVETGHNDLHYTIEMRKTRDADRLMKALRKMRKERKSLMVRINGEEDSIAV